MSKSRRRRRVKWFLLLGVVCLFGIALGVARWFFSGPRLTRFLTGVLFEGKIKGWVEVDSIDWPFTDLLGRRAHGVLKNLRIYDPRGLLIVNVPRAEATIDWWTVVFPPHDVVIEELTLEGGCVLVSEYAVWSPGPKKMEMRSNGCPAVEEDYLLGANGPNVVGFIDAFAPRASRVAESAGSAPGAGPIVQIRKLTLHAVDLDMAFHTYRARADAITGSGMLQVSVRDPRRPELTFQLAPRAPTGSLDLLGLGLHFDLADVDGARFGIFASEKDALQFDAKVKTAAGADVRVRGKLYEILRPESKKPGKVDVTIEAEHAGPDAARVFGGQIGGPEATATLRIAGPMPAPVFTIAGRGIAIAAAPFTIDHARATVDTVTTRVDVDTARLSGLGGRVSAKGSGSITGRAVTDLQVDIAQPLNVASYLGPDLVRRLGGSRLDGHARVRGVPGAFLVDQLEVLVGKARARGSARILGDEVRTGGLEVSYLDAKGEVVGAVRPTDRTLALDFRAEAAQAGPLLGAFGAPPLAEAVQAKGKASGTFDRPTIVADVAAEGAPLTPHLAARVSYRHADRRLDVSNLNADTLGGTATGSASVIVAPRPRVLAADVTAQRLDLARIPWLGVYLHGTGALSFHGAGTLDRPSGRVTASAQGLTLQKTPIGNAEADIGLEDAGGRSVARIHHLDIGGAGAGFLHVSGSVGVARPYPLALDDVKLEDFRLRLIPGVADNETLDIDGTVSVAAKVGGTVTQPRPEGSLALKGFGILEAMLGGGRVTFSPQTDGRIAFSGTLFQGKLTVSGAIATAPWGLEGRVTFDRLDLSEFLPWLLPRVGANGWATGYVDVRTRPALYAELHIEKVRIDFEGFDPGRRSLPFTVENRDEVVIAWEGDKQRATLKQPMRIASSTGEFTLTGFAGADAMNLALVGNVQLGLLEFFTRRYVDRATGNLRVQLTATGSLAHPNLAGTIAIQDAAVRQRDSEAEVHVPQGLIVFDRSRVMVPAAQPLVVEMDGQTLNLSGTMALTDLVPSRVSASLQGRLAGKLLELAFPRLFTNAGGSAAISLTVSGPVANLGLDGTVTIDKPVSFVPRSLRREIVLNAGRVRFNTREVRIAEAVTGSIEEGRVVLSGGMSLAGGRPSQADLRVAIDSFTYKVPEVFEVELGARLAVGWDGARLTLSGDLDLLDGRYVKPLIEVERFLPTRTSERSEPFWAGQPILANMRLDLKLHTTGAFRVDNDLAKLPLTGAITIQGTPPDPQFDGNVRAEGEGTVKIPFVRTGDFSVKTATVNFSPVKSFPLDTPDFVLTAESPFTDLDGNEHLVLAEARGTLKPNGIVWHLTTNTGLTDAQTLLLITTGRTIQDLRARIRGDTAALERSNYSSIGTQSSAASFSDEVIKQVSGNVISLLLQDSLRNFTGLDCARVAPGFESVQFQFCKKLGQVFIFTVDYEQGYQGWLRFRAALNWRTSDNLFLVLQRYDESRIREQDVAQGAWRVQFRYRLVVP